jgi:NHLM bacteriocin system ABC transporter peptidase/ATP-binding protein/NHLM bacteriocin system ABC transporter ATP-binding protein
LNHFLVVEGFGTRRVYLNDPATGRRTVDSESFDASYTGIVFQFEPGRRFVRTGVKPSTWPAILHRIRHARSVTAFVILAGVALMACDLAVASYNLIFIDQLLVEERRQWIRPLLLAMGATAVFRLIVSWVQLQALRRLKLGLALTHSTRFLWHVLRLPVAFYQRRFAGEVSSRVDGNSLVADLITGPLATTAVGVLMVLFYASMMFAFDISLTIVGVVIGSLNLLAMIALGRILSDENIKMKQVRGRLQAALMRAIQVIETIKAGGMESEVLIRLTGHQTRITNSAQVIGSVGAFLIALPPLLLLLTTGAVLWIGGQRVIDGLMSIGGLLAFQTLLANFNRPFGDMVRLGSNVQSLQAELARLDDVRQAPCDPVFDPPADVDSARPRHEPPRRLSGHLVLKDVSFGYNLNVDKPLVKGFSLEIQPGSRVALVGASGSGKSTIGRLVAGLYRPWEGEILFDGLRIDEIPREVFTSQVAMVDDQIFLFSGTIRDNLTLWDETIPDREMIRSAIDSSIHSDVIRRRGGYHAGLTEAARNLSGGQRQRLEIARGLIRNPALIVLDEATSALDPVTEALVDDNLRRRGCTCLIIAHRLSTIRDCDEIIVLSQGHVVQRGTHDALMADEGGFYHELISLQTVLPTARALSFDRTHSAQEAVSANSEKSEKASRPQIETSDFAIGHTQVQVTTIEKTRIVSDEPSQQPHTNGVVSSDAELRTAPLADAFEADDTNWAIVRPDRGESSVEFEPERRGLLQTLEVFGETVTTAGNAPLPLDDADAVWRVSVGQVDVFYLQPEPGQTRGSRRHLCRVEEGGSIFAIDGVRGSSSGRLLAVGVGPAKLLKFPKAELVRLCHEPEWRSGVAEMIDDWVDRVSRATDPGDPPRDIQTLEADSRWLLSSGQSASARSKVVWVRPLDQVPRFFGRVAVPECPFGSRFPLSSHAWLTYVSNCEVLPCETSRLMEDGDPWVGLKRFHRVILDVIALTRARERALRHARLESSGLRDEAVVEESLAELSRLARPGTPTASRLDRRDLLLDACRAVGQALGIAVKPPPYDSQGEPLRLIARSSGFRTRKVRLEMDWWRSDTGPLLAYLSQDNRPVALLPSPRGGYQLYDPSTGMKTQLTGEAARKVGRSAVMFYATFRQNLLGARDLVRAARPMIRGELRIIVLLGIVSGLMGLFAPLIVGLAIDDAIPRAEHGRLGLLCALLVSIAGSVALFQIVQGLALMRIRGKLESRLVPAVWDRLLNLPTRFFAKHEAGDLALRAMGLSKLIEVFAGSSIASLLIGCVSLFNILLLVVIDWRLGLVAIVLIALAPLAYFGVLPALWKLQRQITQAQGRISALLLVLLGGIDRLRLAGAEKRAFARWAELYKTQLELMLQFQRRSDWMTSVGDLLPLLTLMAVFAAAIGLAPQVVETGAFLAFSLALTQGLAAVIGLGKNLIPLIHGLEEIERFRPILEAAPEAPEIQGDAVTLGGAIRLTNVSFRYDEDGPLVLDDVNLQVRPGEFVAIVGPSGSGKSTLLRLLLGFEVPTEGVVSYDGRELFTLSLQEVRQQIGVVLQDAQLFPGDIFSNIVGLASNLTLDDAWEAAELAGLAEDIEAMPMGIHTVIGEGGAGLSSGQRQRLIIARALAGKPKILYLDEATSALDNRAQAAVSRSLHSKMQGTTRLAIAHRISTVLDADRIYVLSEGKIVQSGRYSQLIEEAGPFQEFARRQRIS